MNNISLRLKKIAELVDVNSTIVDVGCDHALLPIYLVENNIISKAYAIDNKTGPLDSAKKNIHKFGMDLNIIPVLSDGLKSIDDSLFDTIIIAGMGATTITEILDYNKPKNKTLILEANNNSDIVRKWLNDNNYQIIDEIAIIEKKSYYFIIKAVESKVPVNYSDLEIKYGPILIKNKDSVLFEFLNKQLKALESNIKYAKNKEELNYKIDELKEAIDEIRTYN